MNFNIRSPKSSSASAGFSPGILLWIFTGLFLPLFISLGAWQLNRANDKVQLLTQQEDKVYQLRDINWSANPDYKTITMDGTFEHRSQFFLDNKTKDGQFGYELWRLLTTDSGIMAVSFGWVPGSHDRTILPELPEVEELKRQAAIIRPAPKNPLFGVDANSEHSQLEYAWVVQSLTKDWLSQFSQVPVLGFAQLLNSDQTGIGTNIWQPTVMSPLKHRGYAIQWFAMATALLGMFLYAGFKPNNKDNERTSS